jgi:hypothetical protein
MKSINNTFAGLASSLLLNVGLTRLAEKIDPMVRDSSAITNVTDGRSAAFCVSVCDFRTAAFCVSVCDFRTSAFCVSVCDFAAERS